MTRSCLWQINKLCKINLTTRVWDVNPLDIFCFDLFYSFFFLFFSYSSVKKENKTKEVSWWQTATTRAVNVPLHEPPPNYAQKHSVQHEWPWLFAQLIILSCHSSFMLLYFKSCLVLVTSRHLEGILLPWMCTDELFTYGVTNLSDNKYSGGRPNSRDTLDTSHLL